MQKKTTLLSDQNIYDHLSQETVDLSGGKVTDAAGTTVIHSGTVSSNLDVAAGSTVLVESDARIVSTTVRNGGAIRLSAGAEADATVIGSKGALHVYSGAKASNTTINQSGYFGIGNGAVAYNTTMAYAGKLTVWGGGTVIGNTLNRYGTLILSSGANADSSVINSQGGLHVYSGAKASNTTVNQSGFFGVGKGATAYNTTLAYAGKLTVWGGGTVINNTIGRYGTLILSSGAAADSSVINAQGGLHVYSGAKASNTTVKQSGFFGVGKGATTYYTTIDYAGKLTVWGGGTVNSNTINTYGAIILSSGAVADTTVINPKGGLHIYKGAAASHTTVVSGANLGVGGGGSLDGSEIAYGGSLIFYNGSVSKGKNIFAGTITINGSLDAAGAEYCFDLTSRSSSDPVILNNISAASGAVFSISTSGSQQAGKYAIAAGASAKEYNFTLSIDGKAAGTLVSGNSGISTGGITYSLEKSAGTLYLNVARTPLKDDVSIYSTADWKVLAYDYSMTGKTVAKDQLMICRNAGTVANTTVYGTLLVSSGGVASATKIIGGNASAVAGTISGIDASKFGYLTAANGGEIQSAVISSGVNLLASSGGLCRNTTIKSSGTINVYSGGKLQDITVESRGGVFIFGGATVKNLNVLAPVDRLCLVLTPETNFDLTSGGSKTVCSAGNISGMTAYGGTFISALAGTTVKDHKNYGLTTATGGSGAALLVSSGALAVNIENDCFAQLNVYAGGSVLSATAKHDAEIYVSGGTARQLVMNSAGYTWIHSGGLVEDIKLNHSGRCVVSNYGTVRDVEINSNGHIIVEEEHALAEKIRINSGGIMEICGAVGRNIDVYDRGLLTFSNSFYVMDGPLTSAGPGLASSVTIHSGGTLVARLTGSAREVTAKEGAEIQIGSDGYVGRLTASGAFTVVSAGGTLEDSVFETDSTLLVSSGAALRNVKLTDATNLTLNLFSGMELSGSYNGRAFTTQDRIVSSFSCSNGILNLNGAALDALTQGENCITTAERGTILTNFTANGGSLELNPGAKLSAAVINNGLLEICRGATVSDLTAAGGYTTLRSGAKIDKLTVDGGKVILDTDTRVFSVSASAGRIETANGTVVSDLTLSGDSVAVLADGAVLTGEIDFGSTATIYAYIGSEINFALAGRTAADDYLVRNLKHAGNNPVYSITVSSDQATGTYKLASGVGDFCKSITISENGTLLGEIALRKALTANGKNYSLYLGDDDLLLDIALAGSTSAATANAFDGNAESLCGIPKGFLA